MLSSARACRGVRKCTQQRQHLANVAVGCNDITCGALRAACVVAVAQPQGVPHVLHVRLQHAHVHAAERRDQLATRAGGLRRVELLQLSHDERHMRRQSLLHTGAGTQQLAPMCRAQDGGARCDCGAPGCSIAAAACGVHAAAQRCQQARNQPHAPVCGPVWGRRQMPDGCGVAAN